jgi:hypothetical protein
VCPASPSSKGSCPPVLLLSRGDGLPPSLIAISPFTASSASAGARRTLDLIAPTSSSTSRPPGFEGSPRSQTPPLLLCGPFPRTPDATPCPTSPPLEPLFAELQPPLLSSPLSTPPRRPAIRRKTLAGMTSVRTPQGYALRKTSDRLRAKR